VLVPVNTGASWVISVRISELPESPIMWKEFDEDSAKRNTPRSDVLQDIPADITDIREYLKYRAAKLGLAVLQVYSDREHPTK
jgi:hypothetical protein